ncbi:uncharacterized protein RJT21DRAFT_112307 [Scheffersomyces amazonensis]|uniref:uncharacterized protein n=1 Tax=Scheffersomyces amazonensis TaxID=1078765 RepID=UPI00315DC046
MSLFRTLQQSPATISIFHSTKIPLSVSLYHLLDRAFIKLPAKATNQFQIDLMKDKIPTFSQYQYLASNCLHDAKSKQALSNCYPFLKDRVSIAPEATQRVTFRGLESVSPTFKNRIFNEGEYSLIEETFNKLQEIKEDDITDISPSDLFRAPLIIDWDQNLIAADEEGLLNILKKYENQ